MTKLQDQQIEDRKWKTFVNVYFCLCLTFTEIPAFISNLEFEYKLTKM